MLTETATLVSTCAALFAVGLSTRAIAILTILSAIVTAAACSLTTREDVDEDAVVVPEKIEAARRDDAVVVHVQMSTASVVSTESDSVVVVAPPERPQEPRRSLRRSTAAPVYVVSTLSESKTAPPPPVRPSPVSSVSTSVLSSLSLSEPAHRVPMTPEIKNDNHRKTDVVRSIEATGEKPQRKTRSSRKRTRSDAVQTKVKTEPVVVVVKKEVVGWSPVATRRKRRKLAKNNEVPNVQHEPSSSLTPVSSRASSVSAARKRRRHREDDTNEKSLESELSPPKQTPRKRASRSATKPVTKPVTKSKTKSAKKTTATKSASSTSPLAARGRPLVFEDDRGTVPDADFVLLSHFEAVEGGIRCVHSGEVVAQPSDVRRLRACVRSTLRPWTTLTCPRIPEELQDTLRALWDDRVREYANLSASSVDRFYARVWERLESSRQPE